MKKILMLVMAAMLLFSAAGCKKEEVVTPSEPGTSSEVSEPVSTFDTSKEIKVISREEGSGTRGAFIELFGSEEKVAKLADICRSAETLRLIAHIEINTFANRSNVQLRIIDLTEMKLS